MKLPCSYVSLLCYRLPRKHKDLGEPLHKMIVANPDQRRADRVRGVEHRYKLILQEHQGMRPRPDPARKRMCRAVGPLCYRLPRKHKDLEQSLHKMIFANPDRRRADRVRGVEHRCKLILQEHQRIRPRADPARKRMCRAGSVQSAAD
jgi:hypothetical protein